MTVARTVVPRLVRVMAARTRVMMPFGRGPRRAGWGVALTKSGGLGQVVGALNTLFRVRGPCLVFKVPTSGPLRATESGC
ncbi:hypothetical protein GCM10009744_36170 [Kribbella alba]|uniref:Uncharacterized protein n=1 Tax=Kribbella alba TaxID=190197 RepID=A0ABN2FE23_9ACTN